MPYAYQASLWCDSCARSIISELAVENNGDTDTFPQYQPDSENDCPNHCDSGASCLEADADDFGEPCGKILTDSLTAEGIDYVMEHINEGTGCCVKLWSEYYRDQLPLLDDDD